jgi:hypothetical protein
MKYNFTGGFVAAPEPYDKRLFMGPAVVGWVAVVVVGRPLARGLFEPGGRPEPVGGTGTPLVGPGSPSREPVGGFGTPLLGP